ncbi:uncharacterized protein TNCV_3658361 [Trichonephila clavipes]|nr:uncharacterized protein TNCV_3658361 [Trichonephila clavipes]
MYYHLFGPQKLHLGGKQFADDNDVQHEVLSWMTQEPKEFYTAGIRALIKRWDRLLDPDKSTTEECICKASAHERAIACMLTMRKENPATSCDPATATRNKLNKLNFTKIIEEGNISERRCSEELWFQRDGATCHTARAKIDLLKDTFSDRLISRFGPVNWPPRSCDLTPLDYILWGYVKSLVYADKPQTLDHLEDNIRRVIADIRPQMLEKVIENWTSRLDYVRASRGSPMPEKSYLECNATRLSFE